MSTNVRVLIVARDDAVAAPLARGLDQLGWRTVTARGVNAAAVALEDLPIEAAVVVEATPDDARRVAARLRATRPPNALSVISVPTHAGPQDIGGFDLSLSRTFHPAQLALRLEHLMRAAAAEEEFELRRRTLAAHGLQTPDPAAETGPLRVLTVGEPAPKFLALAHALGLDGAEVTGAFTPYTAFDYLHERAFDSVVLWGAAAQGEALSIAVGLRRNSRLYHLPALLYLRSEAQIDLAGAYRRGVTDIASADTPETETARRTVALALAYRRERAIRRALASVRGRGLIDPESGLFTPALFADHLARQVVAMAAWRKSLSLAVLRVAPTAEISRLRAGGWLAPALPQIGTMIARLIRAADTAARLAPEVFAIALPGADESAAASAAERIAAVIGCTAFQAAPGAKPFTVTFQISTRALAPDQDAAVALSGMLEPGEALRRA